MTSDNQAAINSCKNQISSLSSHIKNIDAKIARLDAAEKEVQSAYQDNRAFVSSIKNYDPGLWEGSNRDTFNEDQANAKGLGETYHNSIYDAYLIIVSKKRELESEKFWAHVSLGQQYQSLSYLLVT